jgi:hypothetical protein
MADVQPGREARERAVLLIGSIICAHESSYNKPGEPVCWICLMRDTLDREAALIRERDEARQERDDYQQEAETLRRAGLHGSGVNNRLRQQRDEAVAQVAALTEALRETKDVLRHKNVAPLITDGLAGTLERFLADVPEAGRRSTDSPAGTPEATTPNKERET